MSGGVTIHAIHNGTITTTADGKSVATGAGVGMAIGVGINLDSSTARNSRTLNIGGALLIEADSNTPTTTSASASATGGKTIGQAIDAYIAQQIGDADPNAGTGNAVNVPGVGSSLTSIQNTVGLALPVLGAAAAISGNVAQPQTTAEIASNTTVTAANVSILTSVDGADTSTADGSAANALASAGLGLAANYAGGTNKAAIDDNDIITAPTISVIAGVANPHLFTVSAAAGASGVAGGAAGSIAVNLGANTTEAQVGNNSHLTATGNISITTTDTVNAITMAGGQAMGLGAGMAPRSRARLSRT